MSKTKEREIEKRASRHVAFMFRFTPDFYVNVNQTRHLIRGMIDDYEKHPAFNLHHKINNRVATVAEPKLEVVYIKNERSVN